jgi:hypothetical protein
MWWMDDYAGIWLKYCVKVVYMGHRRFVRADHPYRRNKKAFDGTIEKCHVPKDSYRGTHISDGKESKRCSWKGVRKYKVDDHWFIKKEITILEPTILEGQVVHGASQGW